MQPGFYCNDKYQSGIKTSANKTEETKKYRPHNYCSIDVGNDTIWSHLFELGN